MPAGYAHPDYAVSLSEFGTPLLLPHCGGWLLGRHIDTTDLRDATGCYPLFCCTNWASLAADVEGLSGQIVTLTVVTDPFSPLTRDDLARSFDHVVRFKQHFVVDTEVRLDDFVNRSHRAHALRALRDVQVEVCANPIDHLDDWDRLHKVLTARHGISGMRAFSREAFARQLTIPGTVMFRASLDGRTVGLDWWYIQGDVAHGHLAAFDEAGYDVRASYATKWRAIETLSERVRWINLGGGSSRDGTDGLTQFKRGWATGTRTAWLCGRIFEPDQYHRLTQRSGFEGTDYFPAYRSGERPLHEYTARTQRPASAC